MTDGANYAHPRAEIEEAYGWFESRMDAAKLEARKAHGFRNPLSQRRRVKIACTRGTPRPAAMSR